jgi:hypothetical protein
MPVDEPLVSVVVSTYNRPARLARLLDGLSVQTLPAAQFEVVVVDNGSGPETAHVLAAERARGRLALICARHAVTLGPAGGRNAGWRLARAPLVAFTDDDCVPASAWLEQLLALASEHAGAVVQGQTQPDPSEQDKAGLLSHTVRIEWLGPQFQTCNILYPRAVLEALGGFDERFGLEPAGEDTDLAWRAIESGCPMVFAPEAVVYHGVQRLSVAGTLALAARWSEVTRVFARHPQLAAVPGLVLERVALPAVALASGAGRARVAAAPAAGASPARAVSARARAGVRPRSDPVPGGLRRGRVLVGGARLGPTSDMGALGSSPVRKPGVVGLEHVRITCEDQDDRRLPRAPRPPGANAGGRAPRRARNPTQATLP